MKRLLVICAVALAACATAPSAAQVEQQAAGWPSWWAEHVDENSDELIQTFWLPDGRSWRDGHRTEENGDEYVTHSFDIDADGVWTPRRTFIWRRVS